MNVSYFSWQGESNFMSDARPAARLKATSTAQSRAVQTSPSNGTMHLAPVYSSSHMALAAIQLLAALPKAWR